VGVERSENTTPTTKPISLPADRPLKSLSLGQVHAIDEALAAVGAFGEVRLLKSRGKLRFIQTVRSEDAGSGE